MRSVFETMGTVVSLELPDSHTRLALEVEEIFRAYDERFSLYRPESELSLVASGELTLPAASDEMRATYVRALDWRSRTDGAFSVHRPDGVLDLNGIVKAEAIEAAGALLTAAGCSQFTINVGGDILSSEGQSCAIGIADPAHPDRLLCAVAVEGTRRAIATSGSAQRGDHIWHGGSTEPSEFVQVSVIADDIVTADVIATAIIAGGEATLNDLCDTCDIDVLTVGRDGVISATPGIRFSAGQLQQT